MTFPKIFVEKSFSILARIFLASCRNGTLQVFWRIGGEGFGCECTCYQHSSGVALDSCFYYSRSNLCYYKQWTTLLRGRLPGVKVPLNFFSVFLKHSDFIDPFLKKIKWIIPSMCWFHFIVPWTMYLELSGHLYLYDFKMFLHLVEDTWGFKSIRIND